MYELALGVSAGVIVILLLGRWDLRRQIRMQGELLKIRQDSLDHYEQQELPKIAAEAKAMERSRDEYYRSYSGLCEEVGQLREAAAASGWQPIHTAPRDGSSILVCREGEKPWFAHWDSQYQWWVKLRKEDPMGLATHWMPIPEIPEVK